MKLIHLIILLSVGYHTTILSQDSLKIVNKNITFGHATAQNRKIDAVIIHSTFNNSGGDFYDIDLVIKQFAQYNVSAHYVIGRDGTIYRLVEEKDLRIPNMRGIMTARTKALNVVEPVGAENATKAVKFEKPAPKQAVKLVSPDNLDELINLLHNEAKVI